MIANNNGKYFFGNVNDHLKANGWFFGHFVENPLLNSKDIEVAWQDISNKKSEASDHHTHKIALEINILISGFVRLKINGVKVEASKQGDCWIVYPDAVVDEVEAGPNTKLVVIKAPSVAGDKYYL